MSVDLALSIPALALRRPRAEAGPQAILAGADGIWLEPSAAGTAWQDAAGAVPAGAGDPVARLDDLSGNGRHAVQSAPAAAGTLAQGGGAAWLSLAGAGATLEVAVPAGGWSGTMVLATREGIVEAEVAIPAGAWPLAKGAGLYFPGDTLVGLVIRDGGLGAAGRAAVRARMIALGAGEDFAATASFSQHLRDWSEVVSVNVADWVLDGSNNLAQTFYGTGLTSLDLSGRDLGQVAVLNAMCRNAAMLAEVDVTGTTVAPSANLAFAFTGCALAQGSVDAILAMLDASGLAGQPVGLDGGANAAPSAAGRASVDALRARGCTVGVNGY